LGWKKLHDANPPYESDRDAVLRWVGYKKIWVGKSCMTPTHPTQLHNLPS